MHLQVRATGRAEKADTQIDLSVTSERVRGQGREAMFRLLPDDDSEDSIRRRALDAWLAEQDSTNRKAKQPNAF